MKQLVYGNQQCSETIEELQQGVKVAAATVSGTPGVFFTSPCKHIARAEVYIASQGQHFQHSL